MHGVVEVWHEAIAWLAERIVVPVVQALHLGALAGSPHEIAEAVAIAGIQIAILAFVFRPLESLAPAEAWSDRKLTRIDRLYTLLMLLGIFPLFSYLVLMPIANFFGGSGAEGADAGLGSGLVRSWPWLAGHPWLHFAIYYVLYDFTYYWMHRTQHAIPWWWALHSMHHSQRQLSCWSNDRGSYLDGALQSFVLAAAGLIVGVSPSDFALMTLISELIQSFSHANVRLRAFAWLDRVFVGPTFHRLHHMRVDPARPKLHLCNFGQVLPIWDILFGTALYGEPVRPTGVADPVVDADNGRGLVAQQWFTLKRFWGAVRRRAGWRLGEVAFGPGYEPVPAHAEDPEGSVAAH